MKNTISGQHFTVSHDTITLFGLFGASSGTYWVLSESFDGPDTYVPVEGEPNPVLHEIHQQIADDMAAGKGQYIDHILCSSRVAARLFLEGVLTFNDFKHAQETSQSVRVYCAALTYPLHIVSEFETTHSFATFQSDGTIV